MTRAPSRRAGLVHRRVLAIAAAAALTTGGAVALFACDKFSSDEPQPVTVDAGPDGDGRDAGAPSGDGASPAVKCGLSGVCAGPTPVCCLYDRATEFTTECAARGACPASKKDDAGNPYRRVVIECDDPSDCAGSPGTICCLVQPAACTSTGIDEMGCRVPSACPSCNGDAMVRVGDPACRTDSISDCTSGQACVGSLMGFPQYTQYHYCR